MAKFKSINSTDETNDVISAFLTKYVNLPTMQFTLTNSVVMSSYLKYAKKLEKDRNDIILRKFIELLENYTPVKNTDIDNDIHDEANK